MQTVEPGPNGSQDRSPEEIALHKAEKKKRKYERKQKRKAKKAAKLIEQTPTPAQEDAPAPSTPSPVRSVPINNEGLKSARAHYSPVPANVSPQLVKKPEILPKSADDEPDSDEEILERSFATTRSSDPLAKESIQSVRAVVDQASTLSPSVMSTSEYDNSVVMVDRPERGTDDDMVMQKVSTAILDSDEDGSIEETIITQGAQATLSRGSRPLVPKRHLQAIDLSADPDESNDEELISLGESDPRGRDPEQIKPKRHAGFPAPEDLPGWFPTNIKQIYRVDRHGGALSFKVSSLVEHSPFRYASANSRYNRNSMRSHDTEQPLRESDDKSGTHTSKPEKQDGSFKRYAADSVPAR